MACTNRAECRRSAAAVQQCGPVGKWRSCASCGVFDLEFCRSRSDTAVERLCRSISICRGPVIGHSEPVSLLAHDSRPRHLSGARYRPYGSFLTRLLFSFLKVQRDV